MTILNSIALTPPGSCRRKELAAVRDGFLAATQGMPKHLELFSGFELMEIMCGEAKVTAELLLDAMKFDEQLASTQTEEYVVRFLQALDTSATLANSKLLKNTLFFITGLCVMPKQGLRRPIAVVPLGGGDDALVQASTCFFTLKVPTYSSYEIFEQRVRCSVENGAIGFGQQ